MQAALTWRTVRANIMDWRFGGAVTLVLAFGICVCTLGFAVMRTVLLAPLPYPAADRVVRIWDSNPPEYPSFSVSPGNFSAWKAAGVSSLDSLAIYRGMALTYKSQESPVRLIGTNVSADFFRVLGASALIGRTFSEGDYDQTGPAPIVLSSGAWNAYFGGDAGIVGRELFLSDKSYRIIGVMPTAFKFPSSGTDAWVLWHLSVEDEQRYGQHYASVIGRISEGASTKAALADLNVVAQRLAHEHPETNAGWHPTMMSLLDDIVGDVKSRVLLGFFAVCVVLAIAAVNASCLILFRANARVHEFALRRALGATTKDLYQQALVEASGVAVLGSLIGVALALVAVPVVRSLTPANFPRLSELTPSMSIAIFGLGVGLLASSIAAILPVAAIARRSLAPDLRGGSGHSSADVNRLRAHSILVVSEVALAAFLVFIAGLLVRSYDRLGNVPPGFDPEHVLVAAISFSGPKYRNSSDVLQAVEEIERNVQSQPGVEAAAASTSLPFMSDLVNPVVLEGVSAKPGEEPTANYYAVTDAYFQAMGIRLLRGRVFGQEDRKQNLPVMIVSESFSKRFFGAEDALGQRIKPDTKSEQWREIVGVVADVRQYGLDEDVSPQMYEPFSQAPYGSLLFVTRSLVSPPSLVGELRAAVKTFDPELPVAHTSSMTAVIDQTLSSRRFSTSLIVFFAVGALLLALFGLYATLSYSVSKMVRGIGVRLALGARPIDILRLVAAKGMFLVSIGTAIGIVVGVSVAWYVRAMVFGVSVLDPATLVVCCLFMPIVASVAIILPSWRAARLVPASALRHE